MGDGPDAAGLGRVESGVEEEKQLRQVDKTFSLCVSGPFQVSGTRECEQACSFCVFNSVQEWKPSGFCIIIKKANKKRNPNCHSVIVHI